MVKGTGSERSRVLLLRAEIERAGLRAVTHTIDVSETSITLAGDALAPGEGARLRLSFPALVEAFEVDVVVSASEPQDGYGRPALTTCDIVGADERARQTLASLVGANAATPDAEGDAAPREGMAQDGYRCLLVEDNRFIRDLFAYGMQRYRTARGADLTLELANDAEGAWEMLRRERFDMAIIDHFLPVQTGSQLIARIRAEPHLSEIPVVAISVGGPEAREEAMGAGADLFLDKPVVLRELFSTLDKLTARCGAR